MKTKIDAIDSRIVEKNNFIDQMKGIIKDLDVNLRTGEIKNPSFRFEMEKKNKNNDEEYNEIKDYFKLLKNTLKCLTDVELLQF